MRNKPKTQVYTERRTANSLKTDAIYVPAEEKLNFGRSHRFRSTDDHSGKQICKYRLFCFFSTKLNLIYKRRNFDETKFTKEDVSENVDQPGFYEGNRQKSFRLCRLSSNVSKTPRKQMVHFSYVK